MASAGHPRNAMARTLPGCEDGLEAADEIDAGTGAGGNGSEIAGAAGPIRVVKGEEVEQPFRLPPHRRTALEEDRLPGAALAQADYLAAVDGDLARPEPGEAHPVRPGAAPHRAVVPGCGEPPGDEHLHPGRPEPVERPADVVVPE